MSLFCETPDYDPRFERAQTVEGAKARYVSDDSPGYGIVELERDIGRVLREGENPDVRGYGQSEVVLK